MLKTNIPELQPRAGKGPEVTIVMPTFRRAHAIGATIRTLLDGTWKDFELLVRDDGDGTDGTREAVREAAKGDSRVVYHLNEQNLGMPGNLNEGIKESRGDFIAVCHDHDLYKSNFIEMMLSTLRRNPTAHFVHCAIETIRQDGTITQIHIGDWSELTPGREWLSFMLRSLNCPVCALTLVRREAHEQYGLYDPSCGFIADVEMWMRLSSSGDVAYVREPLIRVCEREDDHVETANGERWINMAAKIHRRYVSSDEVLRRVRLELEFSKKYLRNRSLRIAKKLLPLSRLH